MSHHGVVRTGKYRVEDLPSRKKWPVIPKTLTLAGGRVRVEVRPNPKFKSPYSNRMWRVLGFWDPSQRLIVLKEGMPPEQMWATLLHEFTHAALYDCGAHHGLKADQEERVCEALGLAFMHQIRFFGKVLR